MSIELEILLLQSLADWEIDPAVREYTSIYYKDRAIYHRGGWHPDSQTFSGFSNTESSELSGMGLRAS